MGILMGKQLAAENAKKEDQQKKRDAELRAKIRENLNVDTDSAGIVESLYKRIPTNARLLLENLAGVDTPITAEDFTKDELVEMVFLAEKQREVNAEREKFFREQQQFDVYPEQKAKTKKRLQSFENTRGRTSVDPYKSVGNEPIVSGRKVDKGYLDSVISSFTDPRYGIATTLGKYTALDENNKISRIKDTYNFNKKQRKLPTDFIGAVKQIMISPELAGEYIANTLGTQDREVDIKLPRKMKEGGMAKRVAKQMELFGPAERGFDDGGLMDEGGTVDPISGNDVPPGSNQEEVRDDIPAQLSEGEFVFPADVVRYFGLEKLMEMRQEAKMGLQRMDDMGQMGNSEEAIMPDNLPFDIEDLDMEDDELEMAQGGVVQAANGTFVQPTPTTPNAGVFYNPAAQSTTGVAAAPMQAASASAAPSIGQAATPVQAGSGKPTMFTNYQLPQAPVPVMTAPDQLPKFLGEVAPGVGGVDYTEETYVNEAGQTVTFRRYNDGSLKDLSGNEAVIPEGYKIKSEAEKDVGTGPVKVETATVQDDDGGSDNDDSMGDTNASIAFGGTKATGKRAGLVDNAFQANLAFTGFGLGDVKGFGLAGLSSLSNSLTGGKIGEPISLSGKQGAVISNILDPRTKTGLGPAKTLDFSIALNANQYNSLVSRAGADKVTSRTELADITRQLSKINNSLAGETLDYGRAKYLSESIKTGRQDEIEDSIEKGKGLDKTIADALGRDRGRVEGSGIFGTNIGATDRTGAVSAAERAGMTSAEKTALDAAMTAYAESMSTEEPDDYGDNNNDPGPAEGMSDRGGFEGFEGDYKGAFVGETYKKNKLAKQMKRSGLASKK